MNTSESFKKLKRVQYLLDSLDIDHYDNIITIRFVNYNLVDQYRVDIDFYEKYKYICDYKEYFSIDDFNSLDLKNYLLNKIKSIRDNFLFI